MASNPNKSYTAPKGRATTSQALEERRRWLSPTMEWILLVVAVIVIVVAIVYFGRNVTGGGGGGHNGTAVIQVVSAFS